MNTVDNFNKELAEMTKHIFPVYDLCEQIIYFWRCLIKPRSMKLCSFISRLQELNVYLAEFPPDLGRQETASLPVDKIMDIIYHSIPTTWKIKITAHANSTVKEMTDFFETGVENLEPKEDTKQSAAAAKKCKDKKSTKKQKQRILCGAQASQEVLHPTWEMQSFYWQV